MRGRFVGQGKLFPDISPEARVPEQHPLRQIRKLVREVLKQLSCSFGRLYASEGRPSVPPGQLLSALLLQVFYAVRSGRQLIEQLNYNLLCRWFVGLSPDDPVWDATTFTKNRERLQGGAIFPKFMAELLNLPEAGRLLSDEHFPVGGTLTEAWAELAQGSAKRSLVERPAEGSQRSFRPKDGSGGGSDFHGQQRKNDTHASTTDPGCRLYRKSNGREAKLAYMGHVVMENRHGLAVAGMVTEASGTAERRASEKMLGALREQIRAAHHGRRGQGLCAEHVATLREAGVTPHVARHDAITKTGRRRRSALDGRTTRHAGYRISHTRRAMPECIYGWGKEHGTMRKTKHRSICRVAGDFMLNLIGYNLIRIPKLIALA